MVHETAVFSKVRPKFLNNCMEVGPNLLSNLTVILLRFRRLCIGISHM